MSVSGTRQRADPRALPPPAVLRGAPAPGPQSGPTPLVSGAVPPAQPPPVCAKRGGGNVRRGSSCLWIATRARITLLSTTIGRRRRGVSPGEGSATNQWEPEGSKSARRAGSRVACRRGHLRGVMSYIARGGVLGLRDGTVRACSAQTSAVARSLLSGSRARQLPRPSASSVAFAPAPLGRDRRRSRASPGASSSQRSARGKRRRAMPRGPSM